MNKVNDILKLIYIKVTGAVSSLFSALDRNKDGKFDASDFNQAKADVKADLKALEKKTKKELEEIGRKLGTELDRRLTKSKLIQQIKDLVK